MTVIRRLLAGLLLFALAPASAQEADTGRADLLVIHPGLRSRWRHGRLFCFGGVALRFGKSRYLRAQSLEFKCSFVSIHVIPLEAPGARKGAASIADNVFARRRSRRSNLPDNTAFGDCFATLAMTQREIAQRRYGSIQTY